MKILSVDYGDVRTGLAICDKKEILASPINTIKETYLPNLVKKITEVAIILKAEKIVVGMPRNMDGTFGYRADRCKELGTELQNSTGLPVDYEDERMTTIIAHNALSANDVRGKKRKEVIDTVSAVIILQSYLDKNKNNSL